MLGGTGLLGSEFKKISDFILSGREIDITIESELNSKLDVIKPDIILLAAAESNSVTIDNDPIPALETNIKGTVNVTKYCIENNFDYSAFIFYSYSNANIICVYWLPFAFCVFSFHVAVIGFGVY